MRLFVSALLLAAAGLADERITRRPDDFWDHVVKGADVQAAGQQQQQQGGRNSKRLDGQLSQYQLRTRIHDPSVLNVDKVRQYSGYLDNEDEDKHLFYWFFESRNDPSNDPVILWLNGGPGCSSMIGLLEEMGPATIPNANLKPVNNPYSWNSNASIIFIDQPVNAGYSYSSRHTSTSTAAARDMYAMLTLFFAQFPEYGYQDFYVAGESYAGHYIPAIGHEILSHEQRNINLKGVAIGNGLVDPYTQYPSYSDMACGRGGHPAVMSPDECDLMNFYEPQCQAMIGACYDSGNTQACKKASTYCNNHILELYLRMPNRSLYDILHPNMTGKTTFANQFLTSDRTKEVLGVEVSQSYQNCSTDVYHDFVNAGDWMTPAHRVLPDMLRQIPVLVYAGDLDFICNWVGNEAWVSRLDWFGRRAFCAAPTHELYAKSGRKYGNVKSVHGLTFMRVYNAGHTVAQYEGEGALDLISRWIGGEWSR